MSLSQHNSILFLAGMSQWRGNLAVKSMCLEALFFSELLVISDKNISIKKYIYISCQMLDEIISEECYKLHFKFQSQILPVFILKYHTFSLCGQVWWKLQN